MTQKRYTLTDPPLAKKTSFARPAPNKARSIAKGRPPLARKPPASLSKKVTQRLIRSHHDLNKRLVKAQADGDENEVKSIKKLIADAGGLQSYQLASLQGQSMQRGGDSSVVLVEWLLELSPSATQSKLRMLEVGCLSTQNACSKSGLLEIDRIDLNSQSPAIKQQNFMERPLPHRDDERFDIISLSLVLNFVPTPKGRGDMLRFSRSFLKANNQDHTSAMGCLPIVFLVLPAACITNSRFMNDERLTLIMASLGFILLRRRETSKLVYYLWMLRDEPLPTNFAREEINPGRRRNNFAIVLA